MAKMHVKKGDNVVIIAGKDKGKTGKVLVVDPSTSTVIVEGVNLQVKHKKPRSAQDKGGIIKKEGKIHSSNVQILDPKTKQPTRVGYSVIDGKRVRTSKVSGVSLDVAVAVKKATKKSSSDKEEKVTKEVKPAVEVEKKVQPKKTASSEKTKTNSGVAGAKSVAASKIKGSSTTPKSVTAKKTTAIVKNQER